MKELRIGAIGIGGLRGHLSGEAHLPEKGVRLVAGADVNPAFLAEFKEKYGPETFTTLDYREMLARPDIDAIFVTTPDYLHEEHAVAALRAGKAVYLEKPMAISIEGCDNILRAAYETKQKLYLGHNMRHMTMFQKMRQLIARGDIGEVKTAWCRHFISYGGDAYYKDWHADRSKSNGLLLQKGAHDIDVLHWLCGGYTTRVTAMGSLMVYDKIPRRKPEDPNPKVTLGTGIWPPMTQSSFNPVVDVEDVSLMLMQLNNGVLATYQQCHFSPDAWRNYTIIGTEGRMENQGNKLKIWNTRCHYCEEGDVIVFDRPPADFHGGADPKIVKEFIDFVRDDAPIGISPLDARNSVAAGVQATYSLRNGNVPVDVPLLPEELVAYFTEQTKGKANKDRSVSV